MLEYVDIYIGFEEKRKLENSEKNKEGKPRSEPTANSTHIYDENCEPGPHLVGGDRALSPLCRPTYHRYIKGGKVGMFASFSAVNYFQLIES